MLTTTDFCRKSGQGTPMYSKRGISTIASFVCFKRDKIGRHPPKPTASSAYGLSEDARKRFEAIEELNKQLSDLEKVKRELYKGEGASPRPGTLASQPIKERRARKKKGEQSARKTTPSSSFLACDRDHSFVYAQQKESKKVPPCGHYKPSYGLVENRPKSALIVTR